jgi:hypothetical protein
MSIKQGEEALAHSTNLDHVAPLGKTAQWLKIVPSPLWICLLLALAVRVLLVIHTNGVIDGDEALVGIQAQHILQGERPIYFYGQAYMGSLEAYLMALIFLIAGSSVWTLRAEPILLSLALVWLTWKLAEALAKAAHLPDRAQKLFIFLAALFAAAAPLYDIVKELRTHGGYIETFVVMLFLLLSALHLTQRWHENASSRELAMHWAGIGFLIGLGLWIDPLVIIAVLAAAIWIAGYCLWAVIALRRQPVTGTKTRPFLLASLQRLWLVITALPTALVGFAPGLYWGATNHWQNITYLLNNSGGQFADRLHTIRLVFHLYRTCIAPRIIGGSLPLVDGNASPPAIFTVSLAAGLSLLLLSVLLCGLSFLWNAPLLLSMRQLTLLPLLFAACAVFIFNVSSISAVGLLAPCSVIDLVGRYASPLLLALPFLFAAPFVAVSMFVEQRKHGDALKNSNANPVAQPLLGQHPQRRLWQTAQVAIIVAVLIYVAIQGYCYSQADPGYTFQTTGCKVAPANSDPMIAYMQREHIHYAWSSFWMAYPIIFKTNGTIIVVDPRDSTDPTVFSSRLPAYYTAVTHAHLPSVLPLVAHNDTHPQLLSILDAQHITYHVARFSSEPGVDMLIITPLNKPISPFYDNSLNVHFGGC